MANNNYKKPEEFYLKAINIMKKTKTSFLIGGTYAFSVYSGIVRETKDLDIFCKTSDFPALLKSFADSGYKTEITDDRWLAKVFSGKYYVDIIFGTVTNLHPVDDIWIKNATAAKIFGTHLKIISAEDLIWSKAYRQERNHYDAADIYHVIINIGKKLDWKHILFRFEQHWEVLLAHIINFRFIYPSERSIIPKWLLMELLDRVNQQLELPTPSDKVCRGPLLSHQDYVVDFTEWGYRSIT